MQSIIPQGKRFIKARERGAITKMDVGKNLCKRSAV